MSVHLPIFDISQPLSSSSLSSLSLACREWGFFHITNHGIPQELLKKLRSSSTQIFNLPSEVKHKAGPSSAVKTYTPHFLASPFFESVRVSGPHFFASAHTSCQAFPHHPTHGFSEIVEEYGSRMSELSQTILEMLLKCMGADFGMKFEGEFKNCHGYLRINNYSSPCCIDDEEQVEGLGMHTDMSCITVVYQDDIGGLQVRSREGKWMDIAPRQDMLVVNIGDLMQAWSNGELVSSQHRVILRGNTNRFSVAFFWCFEDEKLIHAPEQVVGGNLRLYRPFVCADYVKFRENNERGKFEKIGYTVTHFAGTPTGV